MSSSNRKPDRRNAKAPELRYDNLFRIASRTIPYVPLFESWEKNCNEYRRGEVEIETVTSDFHLPDAFQINALPEHTQKLLDEGAVEGDFSKCRFASYRPEFLTGGNSKLTFQLSKVSYLDYLKSGEYLDALMHGDKGKTFRDVFAPRIVIAQDFDSSLLTNICGVGIFLITSDNKIIVSRHSKSVEVCRGVLSYSASGTMDWNRSGDPFKGSPTECKQWLEFLHPFSQVARECWEETRHHVTSQNLRLFGLGIDAKRLYFQFSFFENTSRSSNEILSQAPSAIHYHIEFAGKAGVGVDLDQPLNAVAFDLDEIIHMVKSNDWEPAAEAAILSLCAREFGIDRVERAIDLESVRERWQHEMIVEWRQRASRPGELSVMSSRYQATRCLVESQKYIEAVLAFLGNDVENMDVLEVGAGTGRITKRLVGKARRLTCIDLSTEMIARNRESLGLQADKVSYLVEFAQDYRPKQAHDVIVCSLVLVHNVDDDAYNRLVQMMCASADTIFLFEHVDDPRMPHIHTRLRSEQELVTAFSDHEVARRQEYLLFEDRILFLKLVRRREGIPQRPKGNAKELCQRPEPRPRNYQYDAVISYRRQDPDRTIVRGLLTDLESAGYKVAIDERDFRPYAIFLEEMERCIKESRFTLVVASPRYFQSGNTLEEAIICKVLDMDERKRRLIPLIIEKVEMPAWLYNIVGIDFTVIDPLVKPIERLIATLGDALS